MGGGSIESMEQGSYSVECPGWRVLRNKLTILDSIYSKNKIQYAKDPLDYLPGFIDQEGLFRPWIIGLVPVL